jgi:hypothetical protein
MELEFSTPSNGPSAVSVVLSPPRVSAATIVDEIEARVCIPLESLILKTGPRLRKSRTPATVLSIR